MDKVHCKLFQLRFHLKFTSSRFRAAILIEENSLMPCREITSNFLKTARGGIHRSIQLL